MKALFYGIGVATLSGLLIGGVLRPTLAEGRIAPVIGGTRPFLELPAALDAMEQRKTVGRVVIER